MRAFRQLAAPGAVAALAGLALTTGAGAAVRGQTSCGVLTASGHPWIIVAKNVPCSTANRVVRGFASRTAALHTGARVVVTSPLSGFTCLLASQGKPGGSCSTAGAAKSILWLSAT
jgi:hypothetical protein